MSWLGLDIGGANIKIADGRGYAESSVFPLWQRSTELAAVLAELLAAAPPTESIAVTMTGELADCFATKAQGVEAILRAAAQAAGSRSIAVYLCDGRLVTIDSAMKAPLLAAASNWHVLASYAGRFSADGTALLIDVGSTTCDLIPLDRATPKTAGNTDPERLAAGELVYTGVRRSPICALVTELPWRGQPCGVAQEFFATTHDAYVILGYMPEEPDNSCSADGRPCTKTHAHARLARSICADTTIFTWAEAVEAAAIVCRSQLELLAASEVVRSEPSKVILSGEGEFLARKLLERLGWSCEVVSLTDELGPKISRAACAHALAVLARERMPS